MKKLLSWIQASRPASQAYIFFPLLLGQAFWAQQGHNLHWPFVVLTWFFGLTIQLYIVYANDYMDFEVDRLNSTYTPFSGGSRVLVEGKINRRTLAAAAWVTVVANLALALFFYLSDRPLAAPFILFSLLLLWLYSFPPVRLSFLGGGELLQMIGVGMVLPLLGYYIQAGTLNSFPVRFFAPFLPLQMACAFSTTLPDEPSDRADGKKTVSVLLGLNKSKQLVLLLHASAIFSYGLCIARFNPLKTGLAVLFIPVASWSAMLYLARQARPGTRAMFFFVFFSILATVGFTAAMAWEQFG
jgi:1,4-dihydroxy-2-naphthoate octaprenyltransferase